MLRTAIITALLGFLLTASLLAGLDYFYTGSLRSVGYYAVAVPVVNTLLAIAALLAFYAVDRMGKRKEMVGI